MPAHYGIDLTCRGPIFLFLNLTTALNTIRNFTKDSLFAQMICAKKKSQKCQASKCVCNFSTFCVLNLKL